MIARGNQGGALRLSNRSPRAVFDPQRIGAVTAENKPR
jgi:hypothetical protein